MNVISIKCFYSICGAWTAMQVISCSESAPTQPMDAAVVMVDAPEVVVPPVPCGTLLSGTPMAPGLVESAPGYIDELTALSPTRTCHGNSPMT